MAADNKELIEQLRNPIEGSNLGATGIRARSERVIPGKAAQSDAYEEPLAEYFFCHLKMLPELRNLTRSLGRDARSLTPESRKTDPANIGGLE